MRSRLVLGWLPGYQRSWLRGDLLAGVTVAAYAIPQVMAYAEVAGLSAVSGLWALAGALVAYGLVGSSRVLSVGPESTSALMTAAAIGAVAGSGADRASFAVALCLGVALICLLGWAVGLDRLSDLLSRPVMVGYLAGIAVVMVVSQYGKLTRLSIEGDGFLPETRSLLEQAGEIHGPTLALGLGLALLMVVANRFWPKAPVALAGMLAATALVAWTPLADQGLLTIGTIPSGFPTPTLPSVSASSLQALLLPALGVAFVAYSDNILTARAFAEKGEEVDARRELLALGAANVGSAALAGFPISSSGSRTAIAVAVGAKSQAAALATVAAVLLALLTLRPVLAEFPTAALGAVVVYAATRLVDVAEFRRFLRFRHSEFAIAVVTGLGVLVLGVLDGILLAVVLSTLDLLRRVARPHDAVLGFVPDLAGMHDVDDYPAATTVPGLLVYRYDSPLFFANAEDFRDRALRSVREQADEVHWFVLNAEANIEIDVTAADALESLRAELEEDGIVFAVARLKQELRDELAATGFLERVGEDRIFPTLPTAVAGFEAWRADRR
jgi:SulP family sulfate permease